MKAAPLAGVLEDAGLCSSRNTFLDDGFGSDIAEPRLPNQASAAEVWTTTITFLEAALPKALTRVDTRPTRCVL